MTLPAVHLPSTAKNALVTDLVAIALLQMTEIHVSM